MQGEPQAYLVMRSSAASDVYKRQALIGGIAHGFFITLLPALLVTIFTQMGFVNATATDVDTVTVALLYAWVLGPILKHF